MDVTFATPGGREFTVEVWYFATVREMKEAVHAREGIPVASQRLFLPGPEPAAAADDDRELDDARDTEHYGIVQGSRVVLVLPAADAAPPPPSPSPFPSPATAATAAIVRVTVAVPAEIGARVALDDVRASDTVARVKELLEGRTDGALPAVRTALFLGEAEMEDGKALADYGPPPADGGGMDVRAVVRSRPQAQAAAPAASDGGGAGNQRERIEVSVRFGEAAVAVEVGAMDVVRDLRKEVERLRLPVRDGGGGGGYVFVYKQNVMDEDRTLRWHEVKNGDTIEIHNGTVAGGA